MITVRLPEPLRDGRGLVMTMDAKSLADIIARLDLADDRDELFNFAINGELVLHGEKDYRVARFAPRLADLRRVPAALGFLL